MNEPILTPGELAEAHELISSVCDGRLTAEQEVRLRELLSQHRQVRQLYLRLMHLEAALNLNISSGQTLISEEAEQDARAPIETTILPAARPSPQTQDARGRRPVTGKPSTATRTGRLVRDTGAVPRSMWIGNPRLIRWFGAAAAVLCVGLAIGVLGRPRSPASITDSFEARFDDQGLSASAGTRVVAAREVRLWHGLVELTLADGARILVEAPAAFSVDSGKAITLDSGRISAVAFGSAHGLRVSTPTASIVDLGTKFGVYVGTFGATNVQVFEGKVVVSPIDSAAAPNSPAATRTLSTGDAADVNAGVVKFIAGGASPQSFVRSLTPVMGPIDVVDLASGGDGTTHRHTGEIAPVSGTVGQLKNQDGGYHRVSNLAVLDGCFIPNQTMQIDSDGHRFEFPPTMGGRFIYVTADGNVHWPLSDQTFQPWLGGVDYSRSPHGYILAHSNCGFTLDLALLRRIHPGLNFSQFTAVVGATYSNPPRPPSKTGAYVLVDGLPRFERHGFIPSDGAIQVNIPLSSDSHFLTFAAIDDARNTNHEWVILGDPLLQ